MRRPRARCGALRTGLRRSDTEAPPETSVLVQVTSVTTRRLGVSSEVMELMKELVHLQEAAHLHMGDIPRGAELGECNIQLGAQNFAQHLEIGEQREDLLAVATTFQHADDSLSRQTSCSEGGLSEASVVSSVVETMVRRFDTPMKGHRVAEFLGEDHTRWAPDMLKHALLDQREEFSALLPQRQTSAHGRESRAHTRRDDDHHLRTVMWSTLRSVTFSEKLLVAILTIHCICLAVTAFVTIGFGSTDAQYGASGAVLESDAEGGSALDASGAIVTFYLNVTDTHELGQQTVLLSSCLLWAVAWTVVSIGIAIIEENEELDFGLTWLVHLMILLADIGSRFRRGATYTLQEYVACRVGAWNAATNGFDKRRCFLMTYGQRSPAILSQLQQQLSAEQRDSLFDEFRLTIGRSLEQAWLIRCFYQIFIVSTFLLLIVKLNFDFGWRCWSWASNS